MKKKILVGLAATVVGAGMLISTPASAADGGTPLNIGFDGLGVNATLPDAGATTAFSQTTLFGQASHPGGDGSMWDPGTYVIGSNPHDFHPFWVDWSANVPDPMLIVNGFTNTNQKVLEVTVQGEVCTTPGSKITYEFAAKMANILPLSAASDGGAVISVTINGTSIGAAEALTNDPSNVVGITGAIPAPANGVLTVAIWNNGTAYSGNDFAIDDITLTQRGDCEPPCQPVVNGVWFNYTGNFAKTGLDVNKDGVPDLNDPNWKALPATPGGQHDVDVRGFNKPYQPGADKGKGDWFVWKDLGTTCPA